MIYNQGYETNYYKDLELLRGKYHLGKEYLYFVLHRTPDSAHPNIRYYKPQDKCTK